MSIRMLSAMSLLVFGCSTAGATSRVDAGEQSPIVTESPRETRDGGDEDERRDATAPEVPDARDAGTDASPDGGKQPVEVSCLRRKGGALITFQVGNENLTIWSTNEKFNIEAFKAAAQGELVTPVFEKLVEGVDCDGQWTWHPDPSDNAFDDGPTESCDALPSEVEANKAHWLNVVDRYCPSKVLVSAYQQQP